MDSWMLSVVRGGWLYGQLDALSSQGRLVLWIGR